MIKMATLGEFQDLSSRPCTSDSKTRYVWAPKRSHTHNKMDPSAYPGSYYGQDVVDPQYRAPQVGGGEGYYEGTLGGGLTGEVIEDAPFKLPENDTIVRTAHQLSRLASRNSARGGGVGVGLDKDADISKILGQKLNENGGRVRRQRSATLPLPAKPGKGAGQGSGVRRSRFRSVSRDRLPPIAAGKGSVTKETIMGGSGSARLRYTSHWES